MSYDKLILAFPNYKSDNPAGANRRTEAFINYINKEKIENIEIFLPNDCDINVIDLPQIKLNLTRSTSPFRHFHNFKNYLSIAHSNKNNVAVIADTIFVPKAKQLLNYIPTIHDIRKVVNNDLFVAKYMHINCYKYLISRCHDIITVSKDTSIRTSAQFDISLDKFHVVYNGVDENFLYSSLKIMKKGKIDVILFIFLGLSRTKTI